MKRGEAIKQGYKFYCLQCKTVFKTIPQSWDEKVSCTGAYIDECSNCGCDLICDLLNDELAK